MDQYWEETQWDCHLSSRNISIEHYWKEIRRDHYARARNMAIVPSLDVGGSQFGHSNLSTQYNQGTTNIDQSSGMDQLQRDVLYEVHYTLDLMMQHFASVMAGRSDHKYQVDQQNHARDMSSPRSILRKVTQDQPSNEAQASRDVLGERRTSQRYRQARRDVLLESQLNLDPDMYSNQSQTFEEA